jgi:DNA-binding MarR family transcriptional regulator
MTSRSRDDKGRAGTGSASSTATSAVPTPAAHTAPEPSSERGAGQGTGFLLYHANLAWQRALADAFAPLSITHAQFAVLLAAWQLGRGGQLPLQREVADYVRFHPTQTSNVMNVLLERQWVVRVADQDDGRASRVKVTEQGIAVATQAIELLQAAEERFFVPGRDTQALVRGLRAIEARQAVERQTGGT